MGRDLRVGLAIASVSVLLVIVWTVAKRKLNIKYSIVWILWALLSIMMAIFPEIFFTLSDILSIQIPVNTVFLIMIALLYALVFYVYIMITKHNEEIVKLTYEIASLKKQLEEYKKNEK